MKPKTVEYLVKFEDDSTITVWSKKGMTQAEVNARLTTGKFDGKVTVEEVTKQARR